jgi:xylulokinase
VKVIADVFDKEVYVSSEKGSKEAAALGGALLGKWVWWKKVLQGGKDVYSSYEAMRNEDDSKATKQILVASPDPEKVKFYEELVFPYRNCEDWVIKHSK